MSIYLGSTEIGKLFLGSVEIEEAYLGSVKVYEANSSPYPSNAVLTDDVNPKILQAYNSAGKCASSNYMTASEAAAITSLVSLQSNAVYEPFDMSSFTNVTSIANNTFNGAHLTSVKLPPNLKTVGINGFRSCDFTNITFPATVTAIRTQAMLNCSSLSYIIMEGSTPPTFGTSSMPNVVSAIYVPDEAVSAYQSAVPSNFSAKVKRISDFPT